MEEDLTRRRKKRREGSGGEDEAQGGGGGGGGGGGSNDNEKGLDVTFVNGGVAAVELWWLREDPRKAAHGATTATRGGDRTKHDSADEDEDEAFFEVAQEALAAGALLGVLEPGRSAPISTFVGHVFVAVEPSRTAALASPAVRRGLKRWVVAPEHQNTELVVVEALPPTTTTPTATTHGEL